jgi:hypothetical protein
MAPNPTAPANAFCPFAPEKRAAAAEAKRERVLSIMVISPKVAIEIIKEKKSLSIYIGRYP